MDWLVEGICSLGCVASAKISSVGAATSARTLTETTSSTKLLPPASAAYICPSRLVTLKALEVNTISSRIPQRPPAIPWTQNFRRKSPPDSRSLPSLRLQPHGRRTAWPILETRTSADDLVLKAALHVRCGASRFLHLEPQIVRKRVNQLAKSFLSYLRSAFRFHSRF